MIFKNHIYIIPKHKMDGRKIVKFDIFIKDIYIFKYKVRKFENQEIIKFHQNASMGKVSGYSVKCQQTEESVARNVPSF